MIYSGPRPFTILLAVPPPPRLQKPVINHRPTYLWFTILIPLMIVVTSVNATTLPSPVSSSPYLHSSPAPSAGPPPSSSSQTSSPPPTLHQSSPDENPHVVARFPSLHHRIELNRLDPNFTREGTVRFNHLTIDPTTGRLYAGAINRLLQLDKNLQLEEIVSTGEFL